MNEIGENLYNCKSIVWKIELQNQREKVINSMILERLEQIIGGLNNVSIE